MSQHAACPHCGQRMMYLRDGARLSPKKAKIFDAVERAGADGIAQENLIEAYGLEVGDNCIRAHIWQINELLARYGSGLRITSPGRNKTYKMIGKRKIGLAKEKRI